MSGAGGGPVLKQKLPSVKTKNITVKKKPINSIKITSKTYYIDEPNSKGFKIGDQRVIVSSDDYPISSLDEVNYLISELVKYSDFAGNYKNKYQKDDANTKINNNSFFKHDQKDWYIIPVKYNKDEGEGKGESESEGEDEDKGRPLLPPTPVIPKARRSSTRKKKEKTITGQRVKPIGPRK